MAGVDIRKVDNDVVFYVKVVPGSSRTGIAGVLEGMFKVKVATPAQKGKANKCLIEFLAKKIGVKKKAVAIIAGQTNTVKQMRIENVSIESLAAKLHG